MRGTNHDDADAFKNTVIGGTRTGDWVNVRKTTNFQSNGPVTDVTSKAMTSYKLAAGSEGAKPKNVTAGDTVGSVVHLVRPAHRVRRQRLITLQPRIYPRRV